MSTMTIRKIDPELKTRLRVRAAEHGRSMEDEARCILRSALSVEVERGDSLLAFIRQQVEPLGCVDLELQEREGIREPPGFEE